MVKRPKCTAKKWSSDDITQPCWYCKAPTLYAMYDPRDDSEVWACPDCMYKIGRIKKFSPSRLKCTLDKKKSKNKEVLGVKKHKMGVLE